VFSNLELDAKDALITAELMAKLAGWGARITEVGMHHPTLSVGSGTAIILRS
jgi:hypothetical protein